MKYTDIAGFLSITNNIITNWINYHKEGGIDSLLLLNYKGWQTKLSEEQLSELRNEADKGVFAFAKENNIKLLFLPPYASNLNLIERLWKFTKKHLVNRIIPIMKILPSLSMQLKVSSIIWAIITKNYPVFLHKRF